MRPLGGPVPVALATPKPWWTSWTILTNAAIILGAASTMPVTGRLATGIAVATGIVNLALRFKTDQPIGDPSS